MTSLPNIINNSKNEFNHKLQVIFPNNCSPNDWQLLKLKFAYEAELMFIWGSNFCAELDSTIFVDVTYVNISLRTQRFIIVRFYYTSHFLPLKMKSWYPCYGRHAFQRFVGRCEVDVLGGLSKLFIRTSYLVISHFEIAFLFFIHLCKNLNELAKKVLMSILALTFVYTFLSSLFLSILFEISNAQNQGWCLIYQFYSIF